MGRYSVGDEPNRCTAQSKSKRERCGNKSVVGRKVCRFHGAFGGRPLTHGRRSRLMGRFRTMYEDALADPALLDLREIIAQFDIVVSEAMRRLHEADTVDFRKRALDLWQNVQSENLYEAEQAKAGLGRLLRDGCAADNAFKDYISSLSKMARHVERAWDIRLDAAQVINARDLRVILARFATIVVSRVPDKASDILEDIEREIALGMSAQALINDERKYRRKLTDRNVDHADEPVDVEVEPSLQRVRSAITE